jgi:predicted transglutaminase-like cysteine proteinase
MHGAEAHFTRQEIALDEAGWSELAAINRQVNDQIVASTDASRYGVLEYWAMPLAERAARQNESAAGDCEDYALEKRARLISLGWNPNSLALAVAYAPGVGMHAVLIVQTDHGDFVLDNLHDAPLQPEALDYQWVSRQAGPSMTVWASAHIESAPSRLDPAQELLHASLDPAAGEVAPEVPVALLSTVIEPSS